MSFIFSRISRKKQTIERSKIAKHGTRNGARFGFRRFLDNLEKTLANTSQLRTSSIRLVVTHVTHFPTWKWEKARSPTRARDAKCHVRPTLALGGAYLAKVEINTNTKAKLKSQNNISGNEGKAGRFRRKNGEIRHIHIRRKEKITRGKFRTPQNITLFGSKHAHKDRMRKGCVHQY